MSVNNVSNGPAFNSALEKFKQLEKGKTAQQVDKVVVPPSMNSKPIVIKTKEPELKVVVDTLTYYIGYGIFGARLEGRQYKIEKERLMGIIEKDPSYFKNVGLQFQDDKDLALAAVKNDCLMLQHASERLRNDEEVVLLALINVVASNNVDFEIGFMGMEIWKNKKVALAIVKFNGEKLRLVSPELQNDKEIAFAAFKQNDIARRYFGPEIWKNRSAVLELVQMDGWLLEKAVDFQDDQDIVIAAVKQNGKAVEFASKERKKDPKVLLACKYV